METKIDGFAKSPKLFFSSFQRKPESSKFNSLPWNWTPVAAGVTNFCEAGKKHFRLK
jgi:hypothetical protein